MAAIDDIINRQFHQWEMEKARREEQPPETLRTFQPIVTISRENGSRGAYFGDLLAQHLGYQYVHREIVDAIADSSGYRKRIIESLDERYRSRLILAVEGALTGQAVDHTDYVRHLCEVILSMARLGGVVLVGRGGSFILGPQNGFHIRFVCPKERRIENIVKYRGITKVEAARQVERSDRERREMVDKLFDADIDDPHNYDMVINSMYVDFEALIPGVAAAVKTKMEKLAINKKS